MSHLPGCPSNGSLYAPCTCDQIRIAEHTDALNRNTEVVRDELSDTREYIASLEAELATLRALCVRQTDALKGASFLGYLCDEGGKAIPRDSVEYKDIHDGIQKALKLTPADLAGKSVVDSEWLQLAAEHEKEYRDTLDLRAQLAALTEELRVAKESYERVADKLAVTKAELQSVEQARDKAEKSAILAVNIDRFDNPEVRRAFIAVISGLTGSLMGFTFGDGQTSDQHLRWMLGECLMNIRTMPIDKMGRWVGYVQGIMVAQGILNVDEERNRTRPIFQKAYAIPSVAETAFRVAEIQLTTLRQQNAELVAALESMKRDCGK